MTRYKTQPPWDFLFSASRSSLQSFELSRLAHAANLKKEMTQLLDSWVEENTAAMLARVLLEYGRRPGSQEAAPGTEPPAIELCAEIAGAASDNIFADCAVPPRRNGHT